MACDDTLTINWLDGDTTSFVSYYWDFGNGVTSNNPVGKVYYGSSGEYLVQLVLTDSSGIVDTLSKTYIVPDCPSQQRKKNIVNSYVNNNFSIYPNPNNGNFTFKSTVNTPIQLIIYDMMGKAIFSKTQVENNLEINITNHPKGIYQVKIIQGKLIYIVKN